MEHPPDLIQRYLNRQLTPDEELAFRVRLSLDAELQAEVERLRHEQQPGHVPNSDSAGRPVVGNGSALRRPVGPGSSWLITGLGLLVVMGVVWYYLRPNSNNVPGASGEATVAQANADNVPDHTPADSLAVAASGVAPATPVQPAPKYAALFKQFFEPTIRLTRLIIDDRFGTGNVPEPPEPGGSRISADTVAIRAAISSLERGRPRQAIRQLRPTLGCPLPDWQANARWFLALAYLRAQQPAEARPLLTQLARRSPGQGSALYQTEAVSLLKALE
jgi:hypothetical protein